MLLSSDNSSLTCRVPGVDFSPESRKQQPLPLASATQKLHGSPKCSSNGDTGRLWIYRLSMYYRTVLEWQGSKFHFCGDSCMKPTMWWEVCWNLLQHALQCLDFLGCVSERLHEDYKTKYSDTLQPSFKGCSSPLQWFSEAVWWRTADGFYSSPAKHSGTSPNTRKSRWKTQLKSQDVNICTSVTRKKVKSQPAYLGDVLLG